MNLSTVKVESYGGISAISNLQKNELRGVSKILKF